MPASFRIDRATRVRGHALRPLPPDRFAAHLTGLCAWLEDEAKAPSINAAAQRWLSGASPVQRPALPRGYGALTIREIASEDDPAGYVSRATERAVVRARA